MTPGTFVAEATQFLRPNGQRKKVYSDLPMETQPLYQEMLSSGYHLEAEVLTTGLVSFTISNKEEDLDISLTKNGPEVLKGIVKMLERAQWRKAR